MVEIKRTEEVERDVLDSCKKMLSKERFGIHVSDLVSPRLAYLRKTHGNRISDKQAMMFVGGIAHHGIIESLAIKYGDTKEKKIELDGIYGSVDCTRMGYPVEVKSTRAWKTDMVSEDYVTQLRMYCVIMGKNKGFILIFFLNVKEEVENKETGEWKTQYGPKIVCHEVNFTDDELKEEKERMINNKNVLVEALNSKNGRGLPKCVSWKCKDCGYKAECKDMDKPVEVKVGNLTFSG